MDVLVVGGGVAGVETALTLGIGMPDARVELITDQPHLRVVPDLVYVPFGVDPHELEAQFSGTLERFGVNFTVARCQQVDTDAHVVYLENGTTRSYDALVIAPGTEPQPGAAHRLRTVRDAERLRDHLAQLRDGRQRATLMLRVLPKNLWSAPAYEFALLADAWLRSRGRRDHVAVEVVTEENTALSMFDYEVTSFVSERLAAQGVSVLTGVPPARVEMLEGDVTVDFGVIEARRVPGIGPLNPDGFYEVDERGSVGHDVYVVGDAATFPIKTAFSTSWQARRVMCSLGGDIAAFGAQIDGIPLDKFEYQMDMGAETLYVCMPADDYADPARVHKASSVEVKSGPADKLRGTLIRQHLLADQQGELEQDEFYRLLHT